MQGYSLHLYDPSATGELEIAKNADVNVYPNPTNNILYASVLMAQPDNIAISISDLAGRILITKNLTGSEHYFADFNISNLAAGVYFCNIKTTNGDYVKKNIRQ